MHRITIAILVGLAVALGAAALAYATAARQYDDDLIAWEEHQAMRAASSRAGASARLVDYAHGPARPRPDGSRPIQIALAAAIALGGGAAFVCFLFVKPTNTGEGSSPVGIPTRRPRRRPSGRTDI